MNSQKQIPDEELVSLLLNKSSKGLEILYDNYSASLYGVIHRLTQNTKLTEDLLNKTIFKIWNNISQYNPNLDRLSAWMIIIARNMALDNLEASAKMRVDKYMSVDSILSDFDMTKSSDLNLHYQRIRDLIYSMEKEYSQILYLLFFAGFSQSEVSLKLNIPLGTVKTRLRTAILKLRELIEKHPA